MRRQDDEREENLGVYDGMRRNAEVNEVTEKFHASRGHGFAAERANHLYDNGIFGNRSQMVGDDNAKDGADRIVDGISIQSKYCSSGSKCVRECFRDGKFRYYNADRSPMEIEVPADFYDDAVKAMADRIAKGEVEGVRDPRQAKEIICAGAQYCEGGDNRGVVLRCCDRHDCSDAGGKCFGGGNVLECV